MSDPVAIPLGKGLFALIDKSDYPRVCRYRWSASVRKHSVYVVSKVRGKHVYLHRFLMLPKPGFMVDHKDRNPLNCQRSNLRIATGHKNARNSKFRSHNTSGFRGVHFCKCTGRWRAEIRLNSRGMKLGRFDSKEEAARVYDEAAKKYHGEYATLNFP